MEVSPLTLQVRKVTQMREKKSVVVATSMQTLFFSLNPSGKSFLTRHAVPLSRSRMKPLLGRIIPARKTHSSSSSSSSSDPHCWRQEAHAPPEQDTISTKKKNVSEKKGMELLLWGSSSPPSGSASSSASLSAATRCHVLLAVREPLVLSSPVVSSTF